MKKVDFIKKKRAILFILVSIGIVFLLMNGREKTDDSLDQIKNAVINNMSLDEYQMKNHEEVLQSKLDKNEIDYFILGYYHEKQGKIDEAIQYYRLGANLINKETDPFVIIQMMTFLSSQMMEQKQFQQALYYVTLGVNQLETEDYNQYIKQIWQLILITINNDKGINLAIQTLEEILNHEKKLDDETSLYAISKLTLLYSLKNQYADAIQYSLNGIEISEKLNNQGTKAKLLIELAHIFRVLEDYTVAEKAIEEALKIRIEDEAEAAYIKLYAYTNLAEISLAKADYEQALKYTFMMQKYEELIKPKSTIEYEILRYLIYAEAQISNGSNDAAWESITKANELFEQDNNSTILDKELYYLSVLGKFYYSEKDYDKAIEMYHHLLGLSQKEKDLEIQKKCIIQLLVIYEELNRFDDYQQMTNQLIEFVESESTRTGKDYIFYTIQSYQNQLALTKSVQYKSIVIGIVTVLGGVIVYGILKFVRLVAQNRKDHLTNLYNRRYFDKLYFALEKRKKGQYSVILFDIDDFKMINDKYGHEVGDAVLVSLAKAVKGLLGHREYVFRYGGEEFVILAVDKSSEQVLALAESIREKVERMVVSPNIQFTISAGVAHSNHLNESTLKRADESLYYSKAQGKNRVTS